MVRLPAQRVSSEIGQPSFEELLSEAKATAKAAVPENTLRAYRTDWKDFEKFCRTYNFASLPADPQTVCAYLVARSRVHKTSTLRRRLQLIGKIHRIRGLSNPASDERVRKTWRGLLRQLGSAESQKAPALLRDLQTASLALADDLAGLRNRAILLLGFAGAMRRSEIVALDVGSLEQTEEGFVLFIARSKADQLGVGRKIGIPYGQNRHTCPVLATLAWIQAAMLTEGALFRKVNRHGRLEGTRLCACSIALIIKRAFEGIGKIPSSFSGHSLRSGLATQAAISGASERSIQNQTGHKSVKTLRRYIRDGNLFRDNAAKKSGL